MSSIDLSTSAYEVVQRAEFLAVNGVIFSLPLTHSLRDEVTAKAEVLIALPSNVLCETFALRFGSDEGRRRTVG